MTVRSTSSRGIWELQPAQDYEPVSPDKGVCQDYLIPVGASLPYLDQVFIELVCLVTDGGSVEF